MSQYQPIKLTVIQRAIEYSILPKPRLVQVRAFTSTRGRENSTIIAFFNGDEIRKVIGWNTLSLSISRSSVWEALRGCFCADIEVDSVAYDPSTDQVVAKLDCYVHPHDNDHRKVWRDE